MKVKDIKQVVQEKYGEIAQKSYLQKDITCCGNGGCCSGVDYTVFSEGYDHLKGYQSEADLGLGCGLPTQYADIHEGDHVLDLGSGAGNDCFVARALVGETGQVTGIDFTEAMIQKAKTNNLRHGYTNVEFIQGDIEAMPFSENTFDVIVSNCVLNLIPDKTKAFSEIFRVLKPQGHFCVSDVVLKGDLPENLRKSAEMYAGCVSGAIEVTEYLNIIQAQEFKNIQLNKEKEYVLPDDVLSGFLSKEEIRSFRSSGTGIFSITVSATKK